MIRRVAAVYAFRSLLRHPRRTLLSVIGIGIGCALGLIATAYYIGGSEMQIRAASESGAGHLRIAPKGWPRTRDNTLRIVEPERSFDAVKALPGLQRAVRRIHANGLLAFGTRTAAVELTGVEPAAEKAFNRIVFKSRIEGRYLEPGDTDAAVIGSEFGRRLKVGVGDDLLVTVAGLDEMRSAMLEIVGVLSTGSRELDYTVCHLPYKELARLTGSDAPSEIAALLHDYRDIPTAYTYLAARTPPGNVALTWEDVNPGIAAGVEGDKVFIRLISIIVLAVVVFGVASAQLTAYLERHREFGVLTALGMRGRQVIAVILLEAVVTGFAGAVAALLIAYPVSYYLATFGIDIRKLSGGQVSVETILLDPKIYSDIGSWFIWYAFSVSIASALVAALYPVRFALRLNPAESIRGT